MAPYKDTLYTTWISDSPYIHVDNCYNYTGYSIF